MLPKGGGIVWGDGHNAPDDEEELYQTPSTTTNTNAATHTTTPSSNSSNTTANATVSDALLRESVDRLSHPLSESRLSSNESVLSHMLSFTAAIPWPFPNITAIIAEAQFNKSKAAAAAAAAAAATAGGSASSSSSVYPNHMPDINEESLTDWAEKLKDSLATDKEKANNISKKQ